MNDQDIYSLAVDVINSIVNDLSEGIYSELGGSLTISWNTEPKVLAWAESKAGPEESPIHHIVISYELARQFYRDAEDYHGFCNGGYLQSELELFFRDFDPKPGLRNHLRKSESVHNMFLGALTWVFFHELGHLVQEHGYIRSSFTKATLISRVVDCEAEGRKPLEPRAAIIFHVTEFAADVEATQICAQELARHFLEQSRQCHQSFQDSLYLLVCGISCAFYRFYGQSPVSPEEFPIGSHPTPIRRLEVCLPNIFEKLDFGGHGSGLHGLNRKELVNLCLGAAYSAGFFWLYHYNRDSGIPDNFMPKGILQDAHVNSYWSSIISVWDEIEPEVRKIRRFGSELGLLFFTEAVRSQIHDST